MSKSYRELWKTNVQPQIDKKNYKAAKQAADLLIVYILYQFNIKNLAYMFYKLSK